MKKNDIDMIHGPLVGKIIAFAVPLALSSMLQQLFNSADIAVVGQFAGSNALAAVGANSTLINLLVNLFVGLSVGANVVISNRIGRNEKEAVSKAIHTSVLVALLSGVFLLFVGVFLAPYILELMSTPEDIMDQAKLYLRIYFAGMPFIMLYNFEAAIMRSKGDTKRPLITLFVAGVVNLILNLILVIAFHLDVAGVAIATVISNVVSSGVLFTLLLKEEAEFKLYVKKLSIDRDILVEMMKIGLPAGFQSMVFSISNMIVQIALNGLGYVAIAATTASVNYDCYVFFILSAFSQTATTFIGQCYGAGEKDRCRKVVLTCATVGTLLTFALGMIFVAFAEPCISIFTSDADVAELAIYRMQLILPFQAVNALTEIISGSMRGIGKSMVPATICMFGICGSRLIYIFTVFQANKTFENLIVLYPMSWIITVVVILIAYFIVRNKYLIGKV